MAALSSPAIAFLAVLGVAGSLRTHPPAPQSLRPDDRLHQAAVDALAAGKLLVAARRLPDPNFGNAVILLAEFNSEGAVGLVVNRRSEITVARVFPHLTPTLASAGQAFLGGPVDKTRAMALVRASASPAGARHVFDGIYLLTLREGGRVRGLVHRGSGARPHLSRLRGVGAWSARSRDGGRRLARARRRRRRGLRSGSVVDVAAADRAHRGDLGRVMETSKAHVTREVQWPMPA